MSTEAKIPAAVKIPWHAMELCGSLYCVTAERIDLAPWGIDAVIPAGFMSDGMSVPRFFWRWLGPQIAPVTVSPSIVHDWLYQYKLLTRRGADIWYRRALIAAGYSRVKAWAVYAGLRLFGGSHW